MRLLCLLLSVQIQAQVCNTNWFCTNGGGKTFIIPYSNINQGSTYTIHNINFGDGNDTTFIGEYNPIALGYQAIAHTYDLGMHIATLTTYFYDSITNILLCTKIKQDTVCPYNMISNINEIQKQKNNDKVYDFLGRKLNKVPINEPYIKNNIIFINKF